MIQHRADIVIVVALPTELEALLSHFPNAKKLEVDQSVNRTYYVGTLPSEAGRPYRIAITLLSRIGNLEAALATNDAIHIWEPSAVVVVGIAGGLKPDSQAFGDVVVASQVYYYEEQKITDGHTQVRPRILEPTQPILDRALNYRTDVWTELLPPSYRSKTRLPRVSIAPIASGEKVFASKDAVESILKTVPKTAAVEMEGAGVAAAALSAARNIAFLVVRAISDFADSRKDDAAHNLAAHTAAAWTLGFLQSGPIPANGLAPIPVREPPPTPPPDKQQLFKDMLESLDSEDFKTFCFVIGVDVDELPGDKKSAKVRELILYFERRGKLDELRELWRRTKSDLFS